MGCCCTFLPELLQSIGHFLYHISPALVAVLLGSFIIQKFFVSRAHEAEFIDDLVERLSDLEADALEYWNIDSSDSGQGNRAKVLEQKIKGAIKGLAADLQYYSTRYRRKQKFTESLSELSDACTGGDFESRSKKPDSARYIFVINATSKLRSLLLHRKM